MRAGAERGLELSLICEGFFEVVVTADEVQNPKPHPEPVEKALSKLDAAEALGRRTVFIGDSPHDIASGRGAGVRTAAVLWGPFDSDELSRAQPDFILDSPKKILTL